MKSAHSLTLSKDCRQRSIWAAYFLYLASVTRSDAKAAIHERGIHYEISPFWVRRLCSGLDRPLTGRASSAVFGVPSWEVVGLVSDLLAKRFGSRPSGLYCRSALDSPRAGEFVRDLERYNGSALATVDDDESDI